MDAQGTLKHVELNLLTEISKEIDPATNKLKYSNDTLRQGALADKKVSDTNYTQAEYEAERLSSETQLARIELSLLNNRFSAAKHLADLYAAHLNRAK
jgi:hypothetical protein